MWRGKVDRNHGYFQAKNKDTHERFSLYYLSKWAMHRRMDICMQVMTNISTAFLKFWDKNIKKHNFYYPFICHP